MIGKKLHLLLKELTVSHTKTIFYRCSLSKDKRYEILKSLISIRHQTEDEINDYIQKEIQLNWKSVSEKEDALKWRRLNHFFINQIEIVLLELYLEKNATYKNSILAQALEKKGNSQLIENYLLSVNSSSIKEQNKRLQLQSLEGLIRISSLSQGNEDIEKTLKLNEEYLKLLSKTSQQKTADYYYTISNVYLDKTVIVKSQKDELILAIFQLLNTEKNEINRALFLASLAKLHYSDGNFDFYFDKATEVVKGIQKDSDFLNTVKQQFTYLKVRISFFEGLKLSELQKIVPSLSIEEKNSTSLNLNCIFYSLLFDILDENSGINMNKLNEFEAIFKNYPIYFDFLEALFLYREKEIKKSIRILNQIIYSNNYFFSVFSRLLLIKIQIEQKNIHLAKSYILSTQKMINQNKENILGNNANDVTLQLLKNKISVKQFKMKNDTKMSILHLFLIAEN